MVVVVVACWAGMVSLATRYCVYWCHFIEGRQASHVAGGGKGENLFTGEKEKNLVGKRKKKAVDGETVQTSNAIK